MSFEKDTLCVKGPLEPKESDRYNELVNENEQSSVIENIYSITENKEYYVNPTVDGELSLRISHSYDMNLKDVMEKWKNKLYKVFTWRYEQITKVGRWIGSKLCDLPRFDSVGMVDTFLAKMEGLVPEIQRI